MAVVDKEVASSEDSSGNKSPIVAFITHAIHKAQDNVEIEGDKSLELERELERLIHDDQDLDRRIRELVMALKPVPIEPDKALIMRASIRPIITISLTIMFFGFMFIWVFGGFFAEHVITNLKEMLPVFLGIYGSVIGFWFGEHTAQKQQQNK